MTTGNQQDLRTAASNALAAWVSGVTGREIVWDHFEGGGTRPDRAFAAMVLIFIPLGQHATEYTEKAGPPVIPAPNLTEKVSMFVEVFVSMNLIMGDPAADMRSLRTSLGLLQWQEELDKGGLGFSRLLGPRDLTEIVKEDWEARVQADWFFYTTDELSADAFSIESIDITNKLLDPDSTQTIDQTTGA